MDLGKIIGLSIVPTIVLVILGTLSSFIGLIPVIGAMINCVALPLTVIIWIGVLLWAGHGAGKAGQGTLGAAVVGGIVGLVAGLISSIIGLLFGLVGGGIGAAVTGTDVASGVLGAGAGGMVGVLICPFGGLALGVVLGALGGLVSGGK